MSSDNDRMLRRRLLGLARPHAKQMAALLLLDLLDGFMVLLTPLPLKVAIDSVVGSRPLPGLLRQVVPESVTSSAAALLALAVGLLLAVALLGGLLGLATSLLRAWVGSRLVRRLRGRMFLHAQHLSLSYHDAAGTADAVYRINQDAGAVEDVLIDGVLPVAGAALTVALIFVVTLWLDWQLALVAALVAPALLFLSWRCKGRLRRRSREIKRLESGALAILHEVLSALRVVKAFGREERERDRFDLRSAEAARARLRLISAEGAYNTAVRVTTALGTAAVLYIGVTHVLAGSLTLGGVVLVLSYLAQLYDPLKTISRKAGGMQTHLAGAERAFMLLDQQPEVDDRPQARPLGRAAGAVEFRGVSFAYGEGRPVLCDTSFAVKAGTRLGIVGATGAGKTTLLNLLMRFYDPAQGQILLDGVDLRDYRLADLRSQYALVLQDAVLFSASVADNIAYGRPHASRDEVVAAAKAACAHDFIAALPGGYDTLVGERGMSLSGGERQRVAIARAFLKDAPILLLDEPTSAVDAKTEAEILEAMERLMRGRTSVIITHRLSPLSACEEVMTLEQGRLVASTAPRPQGHRIAV